MAADAGEQSKANTSLFALLCLINLLNYIDRQAVTGLLEPIRRDLGATDAQMGLVGLAFLLTYSLLPPIFGWLGDRFARTRIISGSVAFFAPEIGMVPVSGRPPTIRIRSMITPAAPVGTEF